MHRIIKLKLPFQSRILHWYCSILITAHTEKHRNPRGKSVLVTYFLCNFYTLLKYLILQSMSCQINQMLYIWFYVAWHGSPTVNFVFTLTKYSNSRTLNVAHCVNILMELLTGGIHMVKVGSYLNGNIRCLLAYTDERVHDCSNSSILLMELQQSDTKPSICFYGVHSNPFCSHLYLYKDTVRPLCMLVFATV